MIKKTIRSMLYGDMAISPFELDLMHTKLYQRLYHIKQLGLSDKVFPDAVHSRFNHSIGTMERADKIISSVLISLENYQKLREGGDEPIFHFHGGEIKLSELINHVTNFKPVARLMALLHDITHIPFGHTLEDEIQVFDEKHDDLERQEKYFNAITKELFITFSLKVDPKLSDTMLEICQNPFKEVDDAGKENILSMWKDTWSKLEDTFDEGYKQEVSNFFSALSAAMELLLHSEDYVKEIDSETADPKPKLLIKEAAESIEALNHNIDVNRDAFLLDIIKNTICADLLDYSRRDHRMAGLEYNYDDRIFKYFTIAPYDPSKYSEGMRFEKQLRIALMLFTKKLRYDAVSEIITLLRNRYLLTERVIFHPTKCSGGAMLGLAVKMACIPQDPSIYYQSGEESFIDYLQSHSTGMIHFSKIVIEKNCLSLQIFKDATSQITENKFDQGGFIEIIHRELDAKITELTPLNEAASLNKIKEWTAAFATALADEVKRIAGNSGSSTPKALKKDVEHSVLKRFAAACSLIYQQRSRNYYKKVFRLSSIDAENKVWVNSIFAQKLSDPDYRYDFERSIEMECGLEYGSVVVHCPVSKTSMKVAKVLVFGSNPDDVIPFDEIEKHEEHRLHILTPYIAEAKAIQDMYKKIWNMFVFVQEASLDRWPLIENVIVEKLKLMADSNPSILNNISLHDELSRLPRQRAKNLFELIEFAKNEANPKPKIDKDFVEYALQNVSRLSKENFSGIIQEYNAKLPEGAPNEQIEKSASQKKSADEKTPV